MCGGAPPPPHPSARPVGIAEQPSGVPATPLSSHTPISHIMRHAPLQLPGTSIPLVPRAGSVHHTDSK